jgi:hypothetical protein
MKTNELSSGIKNAAEIVRKADNLELYAMLLDLYAKALDLQDENRELKERLSDRSQVESIRSRIIRHEQPIVTLKDDNDSICYCAHCWDSQEKLIQINKDIRSGEATCPACKNTCIYDQQIHKRYIESRRPRVSIL